MNLNKVYQACFLLGIILIFPISIVAVVATQTVEPVEVENINPGHNYIDITAQSWQKTNDESSSNKAKLFITDFGTINQIGPSVTGNSTGFTPDGNYSGFNILPEERFAVSTIPEPTTIILFGLGSLGLAVLRKRRR